MPINRAGSRVGGVAHFPARREFGPAVPKLLACHKRTVPKTSTPTVLKLLRESSPDACAAALVGQANSVYGLKANTRAAQRASSDPAIIHRGGCFDLGKGGAMLKGRYSR